MAQGRKKKQSTSTVGLRAVRPRRLYQQIVEQIRTYIINQALTPGDRLPSERELAEIFGVSRPSVREAFIALEAAGIVEVRVGDGTFIKQAGTSIAGSWIKNEPGILEQFQARRVIEPALAAMAAKRIGEAELAVLRNAVDSAEAQFAKDESAEEADFDFHVQLAGFSGNSVLAEVVRELWTLRASDVWTTVRNRVSTSDDRREVIRRRRAIIAALETRNRARVKSEMAALIEWAHDRFFGESDASVAQQSVQSDD